MTESPRLRVLVLNHNLREQGTYFRAVKVAEELAARGHAVTFATMGRGWYRARRGRRDGYEFVETPSRSWLKGPDDGWSPLGILHRLATLGLRRWDVVYAFSHKPVDQWPARLARLRGALWMCDWCDLYGGPGVLAMRRAGMADAGPVTRFLHRVVDAWDDRLERRAARDADVVTVISRALEGEARRVRRDRPGVVLFRSGGETRRIRPLDRARCRAALGLPADAPLLGYVANYHPDQKLLLDAMALVARARPDARLVAVGNPFYDGARELASRGLDDHVLHAGRVPFRQLQQYIGACDVVLVPVSDTPFNRSRWPHKIGDYVAAGRAQVACAVGDIPEVFAECAIGVTTRPTARSFADGILALLADPARRASIERSARTARADAFDWTRRVEALCPAVEDLTGRRLWGKRDRDGQAIG